MRDYIVTFVRVDGSHGTVEYHAQGKNSELDAVTEAFEKLTGMEPQFMIQGVREFETTRLPETL